MDEQKLYELAKDLQVNDLCKLVTFWLEKHHLESEEAQVITQHFINIMVATNIRQMEQYKEHAREAEVACVQIFCNASEKKRPIYMAAIRPHISKFKDRGFLSWDWLFKESELSPTPVEGESE